MNAEQEQDIRILENYRLLGPSRIFMEPADETIVENTLPTDPSQPMANWGRDVSVSDYSKLSDQDKLELRFTRQALLQVFTDPTGDPKAQPKNIRDIFPMFKDNEPAKKQAYERLAQYTTSSYFRNTELTPKERHTLFQTAVTKANEFISHFENPSTGMLRDFTSSIGMNNEAQVASNPIDLLLMTLSPKASRKMRFEAKRKLVLIDLALRDMAHSDSERNQSEDIDAFMRFLNKNVWKGGSGQTARVEMVSTHSPTDYSCTKVTFLQPVDGSFGHPFERMKFDNTSDVADEASGMNLRLHKYNRYTAMKARVWESSAGELKWAVFDHRKKRDVDKMIKMIRKDTKDPGIIDDVHGFKIILENKESIQQFLDTIQKYAAQNGFLFSLSEIADTIGNKKKYIGANKGSNTEVEMVKFNMIFHGHDIQLLVHTPKSYLDYQYRENSGWSDYEINRAIDSGLLDHIFPRDIYDIDFQILKRELISARRRELQRVSFASIPPIRRKDDELQVEYTTAMRHRDALSLIDQIDKAAFHPKTIYCIGTNVLTVGAALSKKYHAKLIVWQHDLEEEMPTIPMGVDPADVLILDDIAIKMEHVKTVKTLMPEARVGVLINKRGLHENESDEVTIDFAAREAPKQSWILFSNTQTID